jgi:hypothetical protein
LFCLSVVATRAAISISVSVTATTPRPAAATAKATTRPAATATTARAIVTLAGRTRLGHADFPPVDHLAIQAADGLSSSLICRHFDESKSS